MSDDWRERVAAWFLGAFGVFAVLAGVAWAAVGAGHLGWYDAVEAGILVAVGTVFVGYVAWFAPRRTPDVRRRVVAAWTAGSALVFLAVVTLVVSHQHAHGARIEQSGEVQQLVAVVGGGIGLVLGHYADEAARTRRAVEERRRVLAERTKQLEFLNRLLRHDIRNDVQVIQGYASQLAADVGESDALDRIREKADHVAELTRLAQEASASLADRELDPVPLWPAVTGAAAQTRSSFPDADVEVASDVSRDVAVPADNLLGSVFENLLRNGVQHNDADAPRVTVSADVKPDVVRVRVADNGPGVPEPTKQRLFTPGERGRESTGQGLGLYLVETLVASYGGDVWVEDNDPRGAVFVVELPRADA